MQDAFGHCEALVRAADKDRFLAALFAPAERRRALFALYAFNLEVARVREMVHEPLAGEVRLQWWRDVLAGERAEEAGGHPVASAVIEVMRDYRLPVQSFDELIEARRSDLDDQSLRGLDDLENYARHTSSTIIELAARILDRASTSADLVFAGPAGISFAITGLLRTFPLHAARGQIFIPAEVLARCGANSHEILAGQASDELGAALASMRDQAARHFEAARDRIAATKAAFVPAWLPVALVPLHLRAMERSRREPFHAVDVPQWRRQWAMWRAARRGLPPPLAGKSNG
jgi:15-cis-phytoene synthase